MTIKGLAQYSIKDIASRWAEERDDPDTLVELVKAVIDGELKIIDPVIELDCLDSQADIDDFLVRNKSYKNSYLPSGIESIFNTKHIYAMYEFSRFGKNIKSDFYAFESAISSLFIGREDFKNWIKKLDLGLPRFWFTGNEIGQNPTTNIRQALEKAQELAKIRIGQSSGLVQALDEIADEIIARKNVPVLLHHWFKHDNWSKKDGLMLLSGFSPKTRFESFQDTDGVTSEHVSFLETLDGYDGDPTDCSELTRKLDAYKSLWNSGSHTERNTPHYFISWSISKMLEPTWLKWAIDEGYYAQAVESAQSEMKEISGKSGTAYLNIIGALIDLYWKEKHPTTSKINQSELINELGKYEGFSGLSERNLKDKLPKAIKAIRNE